MKIYTKTGDDGRTGLFGGARVDKTDARVEAYGTIDELNATLGLVRAHEPSERLDAILLAIQNQLFVLGAELACAPGKLDRLRMHLVGEAEIQGLERQIDEIQEGLAPLSNFILPAGSRGGATLHLARTVARRAERRCLEVDGLRKEVVIYLNRLSDCLFVLARAANHHASAPETPWVASPNPGAEPRS